MHKSPFFGQMILRYDVELSLTKLYVLIEIPFSEKCQLLMSIVTVYNVTVYNMTVQFVVSIQDGVAPVT